MFTLLGYSVAWIIGAMILATVVNMVRASNGVDVNDSFTEFAKGFALGPIGVLGAIAPTTNSVDRGALLAGGIVGMFGFWFLFY